MWSCIYGNNQCVFLFEVFAKIISAPMFSIPHIAGGGRLCLERHWPSDRRRHDSWRCLQTFKAKPPGKYGGFGGLIGESDVPFGSRDKATLENLICCIKQMIQSIRTYISMQAAWTFFGQGEFNKIFLQSYGRLPAEPANEEEGQTGLCLRWCGLWPFCSAAKTHVIASSIWGSMETDSGGLSRHCCRFPTKTSKARCWQLPERCFFGGIGWCEYISSNTLFHGFFMAQEVRMKSHPSPLPLDLHEAVISKGFSWRDMLRGKLTGQRISVFFWSSFPLRCQSSFRWQRQQKTEGKHREPWKTTGRIFTA